jgi:hypothetical protein
VDATSTSVTAANQLTDTYAALATGAQPELIVKIVGIAA